MLCSNCYKKIPKGKEVEKIRGSWKANYLWKQFLCKKCAKLQDKKDRAFMIVFFSIWLLLFAVFGILLLIFRKK